ncbi:MAG: C25 family cysteine peptidase [Acidobacteriota bacterium]
MALATVASGASERSTPTAFRIALEEEGPCRVSFERLQSQGLSGSVPSARLSLSNQGKPVAMLVEDGGDGTFGPGDALEFMATRLHGAASFFNEYSAFNVYVLRIDAAPGATHAPPVAPPPPPGAKPVSLDQRRHLEQDVLFLRFPGQEDKPQDLWYWAKLTCLVPEGFYQVLDLSGATRSPGSRIHIELDLRGWSLPVRKPSTDEADHVLEVEVNGHHLASSSWNEGEPHRVVIDEPIDERFLDGARNRIRMFLPARELAGSDEPLVDVVLLNWIEVSFPRGPEVDWAQRLYRRGDGVVARIDSSAPDLVAYGDDGTRVESKGAPSGVEHRFSHVLPWPASADSLFVVPGPARLMPVSISGFTPGGLPEHAAADYIIIAHPTLREAIEPLAAFYRKRGLRVVVVAVDDVYDRYSDSIVDPRAIKAFLEHAYRTWERPAPRFVLLVGDASWDSKNAHVDESNYAKWVDPAEAEEGTKFALMPGTARFAANDRNLVPSFNFEGSEGHAASDNQFVCVDGDDFQPDMAIGRYPVVRPEEVSAIVQKTIRYVEAAQDPGEWRRRILLIADENKSFQKISDGIGEKVAARGFVCDKAYPDEGPVTDDRRLGLRKAFNDGHLIVHFIGHGGRFICARPPRIPLSGAISSA